MQNTDSGSIRFRQSVTEAALGTGAHVDREAGVIHGVKILGRVSRNQREYTPQAMSQAARCYEGMRVNIDHPDLTALRKARGTLEQWGWLRNVAVVDDGVYGDLYYLKSHPATQTLLELAERNPTQFGLSHNADCIAVRAGDKTMIESVEDVRSVDVVQRPATTSGLFEQEDYLTGASMPDSQSTPRRTRRWQAALPISEADGSSDEDDGHAEPSDTPDTSDMTDGEDPEWQAFRTAVLALLDDDALDIAQALNGISELLDRYREAQSTVDEHDGFGDGLGEAQSSESETAESVVELRRELQTLKQRNRAREILDRHQIRSTPGRLKAVVSVMEHTRDLHDLLRSLPRWEVRSDHDARSLGHGNRPQRSLPLIEDTDGDESTSRLPFKDHTELARLIR